MPVVGILTSGASGSYVTSAFRQGLSQAGLVEGRNVTFEYHWADGDRSGRAATILVGLLPEVAWR
jgi:putative ABC transport system substrate-binding protein